MTDRAPAAPLHEAVIQALAARSRTKLWLHRHTGVARNTIDSWAHQPRPPRADTVVKVATALDMDIAEALRLGGVLPSASIEVNGEVRDLVDLDTDVLIAEIRRRIPD